MKGWEGDWSKLRGFNYHPSYATNLIEIWDRFDADTIEAELCRGKRLFPHINALRWWLSWEAFLRDPEGFVEKFRTTLMLSGKIGCAVIPVLFNRTHLPPLDFGGIYIDHFLPGSVLNQPGMFDTYLEQVVGGFADDPRIIAWDLCNEAYWYRLKSSSGQAGVGPSIMLPAVVEAESAWLRFLYERCKELDARAPLTVASWGAGNVTLARVGEVCDVFTIHPYNISGDQDAFERQLDENIAYARSVGKPLFVSECCWGKLDDAARTALGRYELGEISRRGLGFLAYVLHHSRMPDSHGHDGGPVGSPENLCFIEADGSLRPGHGFFNDYS